jgi:hypothetical protein
MVLASTPLTSFNSGDVRGSTEPRLWTRPLRELTPDTSYGFDVIDFARDILGQPLDPWQQWAVIHAGELLPDGRPRFRTVLILVARQNGKTHLLKVLALYWLFIEQQKLVLGTSTNRDYAKEAWSGAVEMAADCEWLAVRVPAKGGVRAANGEETLTTADGCRYKIAASNRRGGRSLTIDRLIIDELREHRDFEAWDAATNAQNAVWDAQNFCITNQGDEQAVVLDSLRNPGVEAIESGGGDPGLGLFEWSAPQGADPTDIEALAMANPNLGHRLDPDALLGKGLRAKNAGGKELAGYRTEVMCQRVHLLDPAIDPDRWDAAGVEPADAVDLAEHRDKVALCLDVAPDGTHAALVAAAVVDGKVHVDVVHSWAGLGCTKAVRADLPGIVRRVKPRTLGWFPAGPAAALAADLRERRASSSADRWPPRGVELIELKADLHAVCMGVAEQVQTGELQHANDPMLTGHVRASQKQRRADGWVFARAGKMPVNGSYAMAGAVHLARTLPPPRGQLTAVVVSPHGAGS